MKRITLIIKDLENKYSIDIEVFLELYKNNKSREFIAEKLSVSLFTVRQLFDKLGLPAKKSKRAAAYLKLITEISSDESVDEEVEHENEYLHRKLRLSEKALQHSRDEANHLRKVVRETNRTLALEERVLSITHAAEKINYDKLAINISVPTGSNIYEKYTTCLLLSDLHVEELVTAQDVGGANEFNWEIMEQRMDRLFTQWLTNYRGEDRAIIAMAGDFISGIIHDTLEATTKSTAEAIHDLADILAGYIATAAVIFEDIDIVHVGGNHDRISEKIKSSGKGLDFSYLFAQILSAKISSLQNVKMKISTTGYVTTKVGGKFIGVHHGDLHREAKSDTRTIKVIEAFKQVTGDDVYHILEGHTHKPSVTLTHKGVSVVNGSLIGTNAYGITNGFMAVRPSQTIITFLPNGDVDYVKQVFLD